jgi:hypothetical protein
MIVRILLSKDEVAHLKNGCMSYFDACETVQNVIEKVKRQLR